MNPERSKVFGVALFKAEGEPEEEDFFSPVDFRLRFDFLLDVAACVLDVAVVVDGLFLLAPTSLPLPLPL